MSSPRSALRSPSTSGSLRVMPAPSVVTAATIVMTSPGSADPSLSAGAAGPIFRASPAIRASRDFWEASSPRHALLHEATSGEFLQPAAAGLDAPDGEG